MIIIGNRELVMGMRFCGVNESHYFESKEKTLLIIKQIPKDELIIVNSSVIEKVPQLKEFQNLASVPDDLDNFGDVEDLRYIVKSAIGVDMEAL